MLDEPAATPAIEGGRPARTDPWPSRPPIIPAEEIAPLSTLESEFAALLGLPGHAVIAYADAAEAFDAALADLEPAAGHDEIVAPALLGERLAAAALRAGWRVVPCDVEPQAATLSARGLAQAIGPATGAVGLAHAFGHPASLSDIGRLAADAAAPIVEDATDGLGASDHDEAVGRLGRAVFAFGPGHVLTGGAEAEDAPGALLVLRDAGLAEAARQARDAAGGAPDELSARLALAELRLAELELAARRQLAWELTFALRGIERLAPMSHTRWMRHGYDRYVLRLRSLTWKRSLADTVAAIRAEGIPCEPAVGEPLHRDAAVQAGLPGDSRLHDDGFPVATRLAEELIAIPLHSGMTSREIDQVAEALRRVERWST